MKQDRIYLNKPLQNDNVFVKSELQSLRAITGMESRKGLDNVIICENQIVNVVSNSYGHLPTNSDRHP